MKNDELSFDAEQAFLGACLNDVKCYTEGGALSREHWADDGHAQIYAAIGACVRAGSACGPVEVASQMGDFKEKIYPYLVQLYINFLPMHAQEYGDIIRSHARLRHAYARISEALNGLDGRSPSEALSRLRSAIEESVDLLATDGGYKTFSESVALAMSERARKLSCSGIPSTFCELDQITGGFSGPTMHVIAARTSVGKSIIAGQIAGNCAVRLNRPVGLISLEMGAGQIMSRMLTYLYGDGQCESLDPMKSGEKPEAPLYIDDRSRELGDILSRIREWRMRRGIEACIIDYVQIISARGYRQRYEEVGAISRALKSVAMELGIPIIVLAQLSREHVRVGRRPGLTDLRECGSIEQDADCVLLLHASKNRDGIVELEIAKNRDGRAGDIIDLEFNRERVSLREVRH